jgi:hypothetical protein
MHRGPERRGSIRFALSLEVSYTVLARRKPVRKGAGRTIDLSSSGLSFSTDGPLLTGQRLEVSIDWPVLLDGATKLQLVMSGVVARTNGTAAALQIQRHQFRTRRVELKVTT